MAKYRIISVKFWTDSYICNLDPVEKLIFLYILSNPLTTVSGIYELPLRQIAFDTGIEKEMVDKILARFVQDNKISYKNGWIYIKNFIKNQVVNASVLQGIEREIAVLPQTLIESLGVDWIDFGGRVDTDGGQGGGLLNLTKLNLTKLNLTTNSAASKIDFDFKKGVFTSLTDRFVLLMKEKFPAVNVKSEVSKMEAWLLSNPKNKKSNYERFITNWLARTQDKAGKQGGNWCDS